MTLKEKELDARLQKIEKDNLLLLKTLNGIANSFGELGRIMPRRVVRRERSLMDGSDDGSRRVSGVDIGGANGGMQKMRSLEPVMRELQGVAGRVSSEDLEFESFEE